MAEPILEKSSNDGDQDITRLLIKRINEQINIKRLSGAEVARLSGLSQPTAYRILKLESNKPSLDNIAKIATAIGSSIERLLEGAPVPFIRKHALLGDLPDNTKNFDDLFGNILLFPTLLTGDVCCFVEVSEGMSPKINVGDIVFIDKSNNQCEANHNDVWAFPIRDGVMLGSVIETPKGTMLSFENKGPEWESVPVSKCDCIGKVVSILPAWLAARRMV